MIVKTYNFAEMIRTLSKHYKVKNSEIGRIAGFDGSALSVILAGKNEPRYSEGERLMEMCRKIKYTPLQVRRSVSTQCPSCSRDILTIELFRIKASDYRCGNCIDRASKR